MASIARLVMPRPRAEELLDQQLVKGKQLATRLAGMGRSGGPQAMGLYGEVTGWDRFNAELLQRMFLGGQIYSDYEGIDRALAPGDRYMGGAPIEDAVLTLLHVELGHLQSVRDRLPLIGEAPDGDTDSLAAGGDDPAAALQVFVVHGHDEGTKQAVARLIEKLGLQAVVLDEQPNLGMTIIEKFEKFAAVGYAVVIMTPDDVGAAKAAAGTLLPRARQNVVFELGYFVARLRRGKVCALRKGGVEIPSDYSGVLYVDGDRDDWRWLLARDMKAAGLPVDLNKVG